ncbi:MAG: hypothetical protein ACRD45_15600 [Bryobacteraceae bacterium]
MNGLCVVARENDEAAFKAEAPAAAPQVLRKIRRDQSVSKFDFMNQILGDAV